MVINIFSKLSLKYKIIISLCVFIILAGLSIYFIICPAVNEIKRIGADIKFQMADLEEKYQKGQSLKRLKENLKKIDPETIKLKQAFIDSQNALDFITTLEKIAEKNGVNQNINLVIEQDKKKKNTEIVQKVPLQLSVNCSFSKCLKHLFDLERLNYYINIKSLDFSTTQRSFSNSSQDSMPSSNIDLLIFADTYWR